jgi:WD40 repeat protein/predicted Ser/Thr protein kinase
MADLTCSRCGCPLAFGGLAGQCPRCLGALAFGLVDSPPETPSPRAGDYELLRELGRGGMGIVYEARQRSLNRRVAVKMLLAGAWARPEFKPRFRAEAEAAARLRHPGIVAIHEVGELDGQPFFAMELVAGPSLGELVRTQPLAPKRAARYVRQAADAIAHAHAAGVLHRDLKPSNVLLDEHDQPRITDFGLAKQLDSATELTRTGELLGSPNYLPPELIAGGPAAPAGDIYALGALLYQLLTARPPFAADTVAGTLQQVLHTEPAAPGLLNPAVPRDLETICLKCLRKQPGQRYAGAAELAADLGRFERGEPVLARPASAAERLALWVRRNPALAAVSAGLVFTALTGFLSVVSQWRRAEHSRADMALNLYAADVAAAAGALRDGNLGRARELLRQQAGGTADAGAAGSPEFTWRLLWSRCQSGELTTLGEHPWIVTCVAVSPDGRWVASGSMDQPDNLTNSLRIYPLASGAGQPPAGTARTLGASNTLWSVAFTADSRSLVSAGVNGVRFWDVASGQPRADLPSLAGQEIALAGDTLVASPNHPFFAGNAAEPLTLFNLKGRTVRTLPIRGRHPALSPDGRRLAVLDADRNVQLFEVATGRLLFTVATNRLLFRLRFSPDGNQLASSGQMTAARVWDLAAPGSPPRSFESTHNVWDAAFTPDGATLITATSHQQLELWDVATGVRRDSLAGHANEVWAVAATPDGARVVSGGKDRTVRLWSLAPRPTAPTVPAWRYARPVFSPDGTRLLTYAQTHWRGAALVWDTSVPKRGPTNSPSLLGAFNGFPRGFAPDGRHLLFFRGDRPALDWQAISSGEVAQTVELAGAPTNLFLAEFVLAGDGRSFACPDEAGTFWRWSTEDGRLLYRWTDEEMAARFRAEFAGGQRPNRLLRSHAASRTGRWLALGPFGTYAGVLVDFKAGTSQRLRGHRDDLAALAFSPDDRIVASGSVDGTIRLWDVATGQGVAELPGHLESVEAIAFSPDGQTLGSVNPGIEVTFWHLPTRRELARLPHSEAGYYLSFSPDGRRLALSVTAGNLGTDTDRVELWSLP